MPVKKKRPARTTRSTKKPTPAEPPPAEPTPAEAPFGEILSRLDEISERLKPEEEDAKPKPVGQRLLDSVISNPAVLSSLVLGLVGAVFTSLYQRNESSRQLAEQENQLELAKMQTMQTFLPYLADKSATQQDAQPDEQDEATKGAAIMAIKNLIDADFAMDVASMTPSEGTVRAVESIERASTGDQQARAKGVLEQMNEAIARSVLSQANVDFRTSGDFVTEITFYGLSKGTNGQQEIDLGLLGKFGKLTTLNFHNCNFDNLLHLKNLHTVKSITLSGTSGNGEILLSGLSALEQLVLSQESSTADSTIRKVMLVNAPALKTLSVQGSATKEIDITGACELTALDLSRATIESLRLVGPDKLEFIDVGNNSFKNLHLADLAAFQGDAPPASLGFQVEEGTWRLEKDNKKNPSDMAGTYYFGQLPKIRQLFLKGRNVDQLTIADCDNLTTLDLSQSTVGDWHYGTSLPLKTLRLDGCSISNPPGYVFGALNDLETLSLRSNENAGELLRLLGGCTNLSTLDLSGHGSYSNEQLQALRMFPQLKVLRLNETNAGDKAVELVGDSLPNLEELYLNNPREYDDSISDKGMKAIGKLKNLTHLDLDGHAEITDEGLNELGDLEKLRVLRLGEAKLLGTTHAILDNFSNLEELSLGGRLSESSCEHLCKLSKLRTLRIRGGGPHIQLDGMSELVSLSLGKSRIVKRLSLSNLPKLNKFEHSQSIDEPYETVELINLPRIVFDAEARPPFGRSMTFEQLPMVTELTFPPPPSDTADAATGELIVKELGKLERLHTYTPLDSNVLQDISALPQLSDLCLRLPGLADDDVQFIAKLENLTKLNLTGSKLGDVGLAKLARLKRLKNLAVGETQITNEGLLALVDLPHLREVDVFGTSVTNSGRDGFTDAWLEKHSGPPPIVNGTKEVEPSPSSE